MSDVADAIVLDAPQGTVETPTQTESQQSAADSQTTEGEGKGTASPAAKPAAQTPETDADSVYQNEELRKALRAKFLENDPEIKQIIDHRARSAREADIQARVDAKLAEQNQRLQAEQQARDAKAARERLKTLSPDDLAEEVQKNIAAQEEWEAEQARRQTAYATVSEQFQQQLIAQYRKEGDDAYAKHIAADPDLTDEDKRELLWNNPKYVSIHDYIQAAADIKANRRAAKLAKQLAPIEAEAIVQERLGTSREAQESIPNIAGAGVSLSDRELEAAIASGQSKDFKRARELYEKLGLNF